jgi:hypothetical protein
MGIAETQTEIDLGDLGDKVSSEVTRTLRRPIKCLKYLVLKLKLPHLKIKNTHFEVMHTKGY